MLNKIFFTLLFALSISTLSAQQDFENYQTLLSSGEMPEDFKLLASQKHQKEMEENDSKGKSKTEVRKMRDFSLVTNYAITEMMMSGRVIYGDPLSNYINKIADVVLKDNQELRSKLRFYIIKSTVANAYSTNQGIIFFTSGLIAQVENEAELAYIICHEIVHYTEKHNFEDFKKRDAILKRAGRKSTLSLEEKLKALYKYSRTNELAADEKGLELFLKTDYNPFATLSTFDVLLYSYLPYDIQEWNPSSLESAHYKFPDGYKKHKITEISADEDEDDANQTHPNIGARKTAIAELLDKFSADSSNKKLYIVSKEEFNNIQKIARYELASLYIKVGNPLKAYYIAYLLDITYGANKYTDKIKAFSIYSLAHHYSNGHDLDDYGCKESEYEGDVQVLPKFINKFSKKDLAVLGAKYLYEMHQKYPDDAQLKRMCDQAFVDMFAKGKLNKSGFISYKPAEPADTIAKPGTSKVDKLKNKQKSNTSIPKYYYGAFYELLKDKDFKVYFYDISKQLNISDTSDEDDENTSNYSKSASGKKKEKQVKNNEEISIVMFQPEYSASTNEKRNLFEDEYKRNAIGEYYEKQNFTDKVKIKLLNKPGSDEFNTTTFNQFALLNEWLMERTNNDTLSMELYQTPFIEFAKKEYSVNYVAWVAYKYTAVNRRLNLAYLGASILVPPAFPFYIYWQVNHRKNLESLFLVYNIETGKPKLVNYTSYDKKPSEINIKAFIYNQLYYLQYAK